MGARCCRSPSQPNYKLYLRREEEIYELSCVPRTYDLLLQSTSAITTDVEGSHYSVVSYLGEKGENLNLPINDERSYRIVLKRCRFQDITLTVRLESFDTLFRVSLHKVLYPDYDSVVASWEQTIASLTEPIQFFLESQQKLLKYTVRHCCRLENVSLEAAVLVVLMELGLSAKGSFESIGLVLTKEAPYIQVNTAVLLPGGIDAMRLWNDLVYGLKNFSPRADEIVAAYSSLMSKTAGKA
jgi:hypothetical protein